MISAAEPAGPGVGSLPSLFVSHGSPMLAIRDTPARRFLQSLGAALPRPRAVLMVSAHWETLDQPAVNCSARPETIHDFGGFPRALYEIRYPAPGAADLAHDTAMRLAQIGLPVTRDPARGLDHGAWVPLRLMFPDADIPVAQLSIVHGWGAEAHYRVGQALRPLRARGVLVVGSGAMTHNLGAFFGQPVAAEPPDWVAAFAAWMADQLAAGQISELLDYRRRAPHAARNHPSEDHLLPLFVAMGAAGEPLSARRVHHSYEHGVLAMDSYAFGGMQMAGDLPSG